MYILVNVNAPEVVLAEFCIGAGVNLYQCLLYDFLGTENGNLMLFRVNSESSGKSAHLLWLTLAFITVPKSHVLPQLAICVLFTPAA